FGQWLIGQNEVDRLVSPSGRVVTFGIIADLVFGHGEIGLSRKGLPVDEVRELITAWSHH
ncbi:unnamed protein product, partial [Musa textilis]